MVDLRQAAQQALEALINSTAPKDWDAITALRAALAQQEQKESVRDMLIGAAAMAVVAERKGIYPGASEVADAILAQEDDPHPPSRHCMCDACKPAFEPTPGPEAETTRAQQEPVANNPDPYHLSRILHELAGSASMCWEHVDRAGVFQSTQAADVVAAALAEIRQRMKDAPPRREWRSLSEEEILPLYNTTPSSHAEMLEFARDIEAALKEKNHD